MIYFNNTPASPPPPLMEIDWGPLTVNDAKNGDVMLSVTETNANNTQVPTHI